MNLKQMFDWARNETPASLNMGHQYISKHAVFMVSSTTHVGFNINIRDMKFTLGFKDHMFECKSDPWNKNEIIDQLKSYVDMIEIHES